MRLQAPPSQIGARLTINIGRVILAEPGSLTALPIQIAPIEAVPANSFIRIRGLPETATLSEGHPIAPGAWAVPIAAMATLQMRIPSGLAGKSDITVSIVQLDGTVLAEVRSALVIAAAAMIAPGQGGQPPNERRGVVSADGPAAAPIAPVARLPAEPVPAVSAAPAVTAPIPPRPATPPPPARATPKDDDAQRRAVALLVRGRGQLQAGNIAAARLFFERAAEAGLAEGAFALATTYDPVELDAMRVTGVQPDPALARKWYEEARRLGAVEAELKLRRLGGR